MCFDYKQLAEQYPWFLERDHKAVVSPDSDGFLCGLLMAHHLGWSVAGYYDGKLLVVERGTVIKDCVFLDMEILRDGYRSAGHHMLAYNRNRLPADWPDFTQCLQPNALRNFDSLHEYNRKYPFATVHLLIPLVAEAVEVFVGETSICPLLFTDGTWQTLAQYTENSLDWIDHLGATDPHNPLHILFCHSHSLYSLLERMVAFLRRRDEYNAPRHRGDRLEISPRGGAGPTEPNPDVLESADGTWSLTAGALERLRGFIGLLMELTDWGETPGPFPTRDLVVKRFTKGTSTVTGDTFNTLVERDRPLSMAFRESKRQLDYTLEEPDRLP